ncbi:hypothetical protein NDU88_005549 [Pleurodeles waltl]|uniref:Uncharacterized protein n=1 Tax=Pleurodeles waltl TaxID=8319 RepID=A0AAV7QIM6_PLEWA|nr:hypothetical protein NDU88_005549 [Pleurodeles waltl]
MSKKSSNAKIEGRVRNDDEQGALRKKNWRRAQATGTRVSVEARKQLGLNNNPGHQLSYAELALHIQATLEILQIRNHLKYEAGLSRAIIVALITKII